MRILKPLVPGGDPTAETRLASEMLCLEHGARAVGPDLSPLPRPHEPWPTVRVPPLTRDGLACTAHYRPAVGVVYYTGLHGEAEALMRRLAALLEGFGDAHLRVPRASAASLATLTRRESASGTLVARGRRTGRAGREEAARLLRLAAPDEIPPSPYSVGCAFTWVLAPATAALALAEAWAETPSANALAPFNATLAAILYDAARTCLAPDGGDIAPLSPAHFAPAQAPPPGWAKSAPGQTRGAIVIDAGGRLTYVGREAALRTAPWPLERALDGLPAEAWEREGPPLASSPPRAAPYQCWSCKAPLGGDVAIVRGARVPDLRSHPGAHLSGLDPGTPLLEGERGALLCPLCWHEARACLEGHMGARAHRTRVPHSQASVAIACRGYEPLGHLLAGRAAPLTGAPGAFVLEGCSAVPAGTALVLAGASLGQRPAVMFGAIATTELAVLEGLRLVEAGVEVEAGAAAEPTTEAGPQA
jgi:hypothetical protein